MLLSSTMDAGDSVQVMKQMLCFLSEPRTELLLAEDVVLTVLGMRCILLKYS